MNKIILDFQKLNISHCIYILYIIYSIKCRDETISIWCLCSDEIKKIIRSFILNENIYFSASEQQNFCNAFLANKADIAITWDGYSHAIEKVHYPYAHVGISANSCNTVKDTSVISSFDWVQKILHFLLYFSIRPYIFNTV